MSFRLPIALPSLTHISLLSNHAIPLTGPFRLVFGVHSFIRAFSWESLPLRWLSVRVVYRMCADCLETESLTIQSPLKAFIFCKKHFQLCDITQVQVLCLNTKSVTTVLLSRYLFLVSLQHFPCCRFVHSTTYDKELHSSFATKRHCTTEVPHHDSEYLNIPNLETVGEKLVQ